MLEPHEILFIGRGVSSPLWYRCALPATHLGADWVGVQGHPPGLMILTGLVRGETTKPRYDDYRLVVVQQPNGRAWLKQINAWRARGIKVLYEIDDYLHGVAKQPEHDFAKHYGKDVLRRFEMCMRACDGLLCSTQYIARRYAKFNRNVYVCRNGLDVDRYVLTRPKRSTVNIIWAGATGHLSALLPWLNAIIPIMAEHEDTCFISIGQPTNMAANVGKRRAIDVPFAPLECYPAAMCLGDIAIAPATNTAWYRGKSDLRWLEAAALGMPVIADPNVYDEIEPGVTGFHASTPAELSELLPTLIADPDLRARVGEAARQHVLDERSIEVAAAQWFEVCAAVVGEYESVSQLRRT